MNYTENFNLGLPLVTEKYDVNVFNTNNTIIDETLTHVNEKTNPHEVTAAQIGLGNVDNTSDATKPVSTPQAQAIAQAVAAEATRARAAEEANADAIANLEGMIPDIATTTTPGIVKPDGTTITVEEDGTISAVQATIDSALSTTSTNAVQNAVITNALNTKANQATTYTKTEVDNLMSAFETNIDWKEAVATYADIATTYPNPADGWTVNVKDTDYTYRFNGTSWIVISANAIPDATTSVKGLMTPAMVTKLEGIEAGAQVNTVTGVKGDAESTYRTGNINITKNNIGLGNVPNVATNDQAPTFTQASTRTNIVSGETLSVLFGKIMKFFNDLKTVAFSGSYNDLTNKPTIGNANLTIQKNGVAVKTFSANATEDVSANITVPTKTSELTNDSGFITSEDVGVTGVKGSSESTYRSGDVNITAANIGLGNVGNYKAVSTVANQGLTNQEQINARANIGAGTSSFSGDYDDLRNKPTIPTVNNATLTIQKNGSTVKTFTANASENVTANITVPTKTSEITNDSGYITSADIAVTGVKGNSESSYRTGNVNITAANIGLGNVGNYKAVSTVANQGLTDTEKANARANIGAGTSSFSGSYTDLTNKPTIPTVNNATLTIQKNGTNVQTFTANQASNATANITVPTKVSELTNDSGYTTNVGTVTSVATGAGLTGGTITGSGTLKAKLKSETKSTLTAADKGSTSSREYAVGLDASGNLSVNVPWENNTYTVNNGTLTIKKNGTAVQTFSANQSSSVDANITVPTKVSELTNDSGYTTNTGTVTSVKVGNTAYKPTSGVVSLPAYPTNTDTHRPINVNGTQTLGNNTTALNLKNGSNVTITGSGGDVTIAATDTNTHRPIQVNGTEILGNNTTALNLKAGSNVTVTNSSGTVTIAASDSSRTTSQISQVGSDAASSAGWYKVCSGSLTGYSNVSLIFAVHNTADYNAGILTFDLRCDNGTSLTVKKFGWLVRYGYTLANFIVNTSGNNWAIYQNITRSQHYRDTWTVLQESSTNGKTASYTLNNSTTKESSTPTATATSVDLATANYANSAGAVAWGNVSSKPSYYDAKAIKSITRSGTTFTYTCLDNTTGTFTQQDNNTWNAMVGATSSANGSVGYVNAVPPKDGYNTKFLRADGSWQVPSGTATVNNGTLTIKKNGTAVQTFTANQSSSVDANITVPTKVSELTNDSGYTKNAGTVTSVATGTGLTGGTITSSGTISTYLARVQKDSKVFPGANKIVWEEYTAGDSYNLPSNAWYHIISMQGSDTKYGTQLALGMTTEAAYYRNYNNSTWGSWKSIINTVPTVNNGTLTIQKNGTNVQTFTANQSGNATANITVPTKTSELTNDSGYITSSAVTGVKGNSESSYRTGNVNITATNIGLGNVGNFKAVSTVASQGLTNTEKSNARANIGAGTSSFSGSYNDLTNKPTIPTVNNGTLTIQKNGTNVQTFTANQSSNATANITVPTKVSELTNDSGYTTNTGTVTSVKVGTTSYSPSSGVVSLPAYPTVNNATLTIQQNGTSKATFTANSSSAATANIITDTWTSTAAVNSGTVTFSGLNDSYGYDLYCENKLITIKSVTKSGSGTSTTLTYTVGGAANNDVCKLRILK